ncbi:MAG: helix-turn-helix domain-containing protein [Verrucomicrobiales bacterium]
MAQTIGQLLRATREGKGMVVEDVAFHTRIHPKIIRNLEADDYSGFANLTYAKGFLKLYSNFVDVDATEVLADFGNTSDLGMAGDYSYLEPMFDRVEGRMKLESNRRANPAMLGIVTALILIPIIGVIYALTRPENPGTASSVEGSGAPANPNPAQPAGVAPADPADGAGDSPGQPADADPVAGADLNDPQGGAIDIKSASEEAERLRQGR